MNGWEVLLFVAAFSASVGVPLALGSSERYERLARSFVFLSLGLTWVVITRLTYAFVVQDTSLELVVDHSRPDLSVMRRIMGLWGGSSGSLLFFVAIVGTTLGFAMKERRTALVGLLIAPLLWALATIESPLATLDVPAIRGNGLSPILEHWAMLAHPPLLYFGLALSMVPVVRDRRDSTSRNIEFAALSILAIALALGGRWAYTELGWGGWWAWDPVENAALMPFLLLVLSIHAPASSKMRFWPLLLIWPINLASTAMTRTSLRTSVHAFADAEGLGWFLWPLTIVGTIAALGLTRFERSQLDDRKASVWVDVPYALLSWTTLVVVLGTFRPFLPGEATAPDFYERFLLPTTLVGVVLMGVLPRLRKVAPRRAIFEAAIGAIAGCTLAFFLGPTPTQVLLAAALGAAIGTLTPMAWTWKYHVVGAHLGLVLVLVGALGAASTTTTTIGLSPGQTTEIEGHRITNRSLDLAPGDPAVLTATLLVDGSEIQPSLAIYPSRGLRLPELATHDSFVEETQVLLRSAEDDGSVLVTVNVIPLTHAVWFGAALIAITSLRAVISDRTGRFRSEPD